jgi:hypothetical protein
MNIHFDRREPMITTRKVWTQPEVPWLLVGGIVLILALFDRVLITNQASPTDQALDWITIISAGIGSCCSWIVSYRASLQSTPSLSAALTIRIFVCWLIGPFVVVGATFPARDIDGGLILLYVPFLGLLLTSFLLPLLFKLRQRSEPSRCQ